MSRVQKLVIAASLFAAALLPCAAFGQTPIYFINERPAAQLTGDYTSAAYSAAVALNASSPNAHFAKAVAHAKTAEDMQNFIEQLAYYAYPIGKRQFATLQEWEAARDAFLAIYGHDAVFAKYYVPARVTQIEKSYFASNNIVDGVMVYRRGKWTTSSLTAYSLTVKAAELGEYDLEN